MLRTSVVPTMLKAGRGRKRDSVEAEATLDIRALPDEDIDRFYAEMAKVIADPAVKIVPLPQSRPPSHGIQTQIRQMTDGWKQSRQDECIRRHRAAIDVYRGQRSGAKLRAKAASSRMRHSGSAHRRNE